MLTMIRLLLQCQLQIDEQEELKKALEKQRDEVSFPSA
jgi:hypothetical protein